MEIKSKVDLYRGLHQIIPKGTTLNAELIDSAFYRIVDGPYEGGEYWIHHFEKIEKNYSEKEWNDRETYYLAELDREKAANKRAIKLLAEMSVKMLEKNKEIERLNFFISALSIGLTASSEAISILRETAKQNG